MKNAYKAIFILAITLLVVSCKRQESLQRYFVECQDRKGFVTVDISSSVISLTQGEDAPKEVKIAVESIEKVNIVAMPYEGNETQYDSEKERVKNIFLNSKKYKKLSEFKENERRVGLYYLGDPKNIDEVVAFGYSKEVGIGIARLLGDDMNPSEVLKALKHVKIDVNENMKGMPELIKVFDKDRKLYKDKSQEKAMQE